MKIIAHRGASGEFPENTLLAFEEAIKQQADGIELDAQFHQPSGKFVLLHDSYVTNKAGIEYHFNELSLEELQRITQDKQGITTLTDALVTINGRCLVNIELKTSTLDTTEIYTIVNALQQLLGEFVQGNKFSFPQFIISAFNHPLLQAIKQKMPDVNTAALIAHCPLLPNELGNELQVHSVNPAINCVNQPLVNDIHRQGLSVWVYTVDREQDIQQCISLGVDAIFTNYPARTRAVVEQSINVLI